MIAAPLGVVLMLLSVFPEIFSPSNTWEDTTRGDVISLSDRDPLCEVLRHDGGEVRISLKYTPRTLRNYQNVFQTANFNEGIRFEIDESGNVAVLVSDGNDGFLVVGSEQKALVAQEMSVMIRVVANDGVYMSVNGTVELHTRGVPKPSCDRTLLGAGFDNSRSFDGQVRAKMVAGSTRDLVGAREQVRILGQVLLFGSFMLWSIRPDYDLNGTAISSNADSI